jgi:hypothetical protein
MVETPQIIGRKQNIVTEMALHSRNDVPLMFVRELRSFRVAEYNIGTAVKVVSTENRLPTRAGSAKGSTLSKVPRRSIYKG